MYILNVMASISAAVMTLYSIVVDSLANGSA